MDVKHDDAGAIKATVDSLADFLDRNRAAADVLAKHGWFPQMFVFPKTPAHFNDLMLAFSLAGCKAKRDGKSNDGKLFFNVRLNDKMSFKVLVAPEHIPGERTHVRDEPVFENVYPDWLSEMMDES